LPTAAQVTNLPHIGAHKQCPSINPWRLAGASGGPIRNRPQVANLPHIGTHKYLKEEKYHVANST
jgi:hypothetical protein